MLGLFDEDIELDSEEKLFFECFLLAKESNLVGGINFEVVREYCKRYELDTILVYRVLKNM